MKIYNKPAREKGGIAPAQERRRIRPVVFCAVLALKLYRVSLSPVFYALGVRCRHAPSCSLYAISAFQRHGAWAGFWLTLSRLSRCHPFGSYGWDPVPETQPRAGLCFWRLGDWGWTVRGIADERTEKPRNDAQNSTES